MTTFTTEDRQSHQNDVQFLVDDLIATITQPYTPEFLVRKAAKVLRQSLKMQAFFAEHAPMEYQAYLNSLGSNEQ